MSEHDIPHVSGHELVLRATSNVDDAPICVHRYPDGHLVLSRSVSADPEPGWCSRTVIAHGVVLVDGVPTGFDQLLAHAAGELQGIDR